MTNCLHKISSSQIIKKKINKLQVISIKFKHNSFDKSNILSHCLIKEALNDSGVYARIHCMKRISSCKKGREKLFFPHVQSTYISLLLYCPLIRYFEETYKEKEYDMVKLFQRQYFCTRPMCMQLMKNSVVGK